MTVRLLILDDDPMVASTLALVAESIGAATCTATEPEPFFRRLQEFQPTHVFIDLNMPHRDGLQVLTDLAELGCRARIIVGSGVGSRVLEAATRSAREQGLSVAGMLPKPFPVVELRRLLQDADGDAVAAGASAVRARDFVPDVEDVRQALNERQLSLMYQPKVRCADQQLSGVEALARWQHPCYGMIGPDQFVPLAEAGGLIDELTLQVLDLALAWYADWQRRQPQRSRVRLALNLSARSLHRQGLVDEIHARCDRFGVDPCQLTFELTETAAMEDPVAALALLTRLRVHGFQLSLDDFGTGYSSMLQLVRLPFSELKIDRSFVMTALESQESRAVIRSIIDLGHSLGLQVTAEGVEHREAMDYLNIAGCDDAQGYWIARPMPAAQFEAWADAAG